MNKAIFLYTDYGLSHTLLPGAVCSHFAADLFDVQTELKREMARPSSLSAELKSFVQKGLVIPAASLAKLLDDRLSCSAPKTVVLFNFPLTTEQMDNLLPVLDKQQYTNRQLLVFLQEDPQDFKTNYFKEPEAAAYLDKFGDNAYSTWELGFEKRRGQIDEIVYRWGSAASRLFNVTYQQELNKEYVIGLLNEVW